MKIDEKTLDRVAKLAHLDFSDPAARTAMLADMERVIGFVEKLNEVDTTGVEPLIFMTEETTFSARMSSFRRTLSPRLTH